MALVNKQKGENALHIAVVGDASIASGMALEAINHLAVSNANVLIILNDNSIGIDPAVGGLKNYFEKLKSKTIKKERFFKTFEMPYTGVIDGHDLNALFLHLTQLKKLTVPRVLHIATKKGKGLDLAEKEQILYHAPGKFDKKSGIIQPAPATTLSKFQDVFGKTLVELAEKNSKIMGITAAMPTGTSLKYMMEIFPERCYDVGIAEQHATTLAAGIATQGFIPFYAIYSTFLQRAYDQIIHDIAIQNLPVIICIDRAGLVGEAGATHHGIFDMAMLRLVPNLVVAAPKDEISLRNLLYTAQLGINFPLAIRYPRGEGQLKNWKLPFKKIKIGQGLCIKKGEKIAVLSIGTIFNNVVEAIQNIKQKKEVGHFAMEFVKPLDTFLLARVFQNYDAIITVENGCLAGGFGSAIIEYANEKQYKKPIKRIGISDTFIAHGSVAV